MRLYSLADQWCEAVDKEALRSQLRKTCRPGLYRFKLVRRQHRVWETRVKAGFDEDVQLLPTLDDVCPDWSSETRRSVRADLQSLWLKVRWRRSWADSVDTASYFVAMALLLAAMVIAPALAAMLSVGSASADNTFVVYLATTLGCAVIWASMLALILLVPSDRIIFVVFSALTVASLTAGFYIFNSGTDNSFAHGFAVACYSSVVSVWAALALLYIVDKAGLLLQHRPSRDLPHATATDALLRVVASMRAVEGCPDPATRRTWADFLEDSANAIARHLRSFSGSGDPATDEWLSLRASGFTAYFRGLKRWVYHPGSTTWADLEQVLTEQFGHVALGNWRDVGWEEPGPAVTRAKRLRLTNVVRTAVVALLPAIAFLAIQASPYRFSDELAGRFQLGIVLWGILYVLIGWTPTPSRTSRFCPDSRVRAPAVRRGRRLPPKVLPVQPQSARDPIDDEGRSRAEAPGSIRPPAQTLIRPESGRDGWG